jgi:hypothetical protein
MFNKQHPGGAVVVLQRQVGHLFCSVFNQTADSADSAACVTCVITKQPNFRKIFVLITQPWNL